MQISKIDEGKYCHVMFNKKEKVINIGYISSIFGKLKDEPITFERLNKDMLEGKKLVIYIKKDDKYKVILDHDKNRNVAKRIFNFLVDPDSALFFDDIYDRFMNRGCENSIGITSDRLVPTDATEFKIMMDFLKLYDSKKLLLLLYGKIASLKMKTK